MKGRNLSFLFLIIVISLLMLSINSVDGRDVYIDSEWNVVVDGIIDENAKVFYSFNSSLDNITPNYQIIPIVDKGTINGGDNFTISFHISGRGKVVSNKLITYFPIELLKEEPIYYSYIGEAERDDELFCTWYNMYPQVDVGSKRGALISFVNATFRRAYPDSPIIFGEKAINGHSPVNIKANSSEDASAGDYIIKINFLYSDGEKWYSSQGEVIIHIREWHEVWYLYIIISVLLISLGILIDKLWIRFVKKKNGLNDTEKQETGNEDAENKNIKRT